MRTAAVLTAAGSGSRLGHRLPKALVPLDGTPLVTHAARGLVRSGVVDVLVVTAPEGHLAAVGEACAEVDGVPVLLTAGGASRQASVAAGLALLPTDVDVVLVHDAARALTPPSLVRRVVAAVRDGHPAVVPAVPVTDTLVQVAPAPAGDPAGSSDPVPHGAVPVSGTPDRSVLRAVQTPQGFDRAVLDRAHAAAGHRAADERSAATDDASLVAALGIPVVAVPGDERAAKVTVPRDLALAGLLLAAGTPDDDDVPPHDAARAAAPSDADRVRT